MTGVDLYGAAGGWWDQAAGRYQRGQIPAVGSILVFRRDRRVPVRPCRGRRPRSSARRGPGRPSNWYHGAVSTACRSSTPRPITIGQRSRRWTCAPVNWGATIRPSALSIPKSARADVASASTGRVRSKHRRVADASGPSQHRDVSFCDRQRRLDRRAQRGRRLRIAESAATDPLCWRPRSKTG